jgi:hypothetical protein
MITALLIVHGLLAVALLGALTHQSFAVVRTGGSGKRGFVDRFRSVNTPTFTNAIILLFVITALGGGLLYPTYRIDVRTTLEDLQMRAANGVFEMKEHFVAIGLGLLPAYAFFWRTPLEPSQATARRALTWMLAFVVWWSYLVGHVLNNIKGLF